MTTTTQSNEIGSLENIRAAIEPLTGNSGFQIDSIKLDVWYGRLDLLLHSKEMDIAISIKGAIDQANLQQYNSVHQKYLSSFLRNCIFLVPAHGKLFPLGAGGISYRYRKVICGYDPQFRIPESETENLLAYWGRPTFLAFPAGDVFRILDLDPQLQVENAEMNPGGHVTRSSETGSAEDSVPDDEALYLMRELAGRGNPAFQSNKFHGVPEIFQDPGALFVFREFCENISRNLPCLKTRFRPEALDETIRIYVSWVNELEIANRSKTKNRRKTE